MRVFTGFLIACFIVLGALLPVAAMQARTAPFVWAHHEVTTKDAQAQRLFDEGLTCLYAFNRECAQDRFLAASRQDPTLAIAWWGYAMGLGPNINYSSDGAMLSKALAALETARALAPGASPSERALIDALAARYAITSGGGGETRALAYARAMQQVAKAFPQDPDAQAFYIESYLDIAEPADAALIGDPKTMQSTADLLAQRWPKHLGLQHFLIHISEPEYIDRAVVSANFLYATTLAPEASHLNHMASHVYYYLGQWSKFAGASELAIAMDQQQAATRNAQPAKLDYWAHNLDFWYGGAVMSGDQKSASAAVDVAAQTFAPLRWVYAQRLGHNEEAMRLIDQTQFAQEIPKTKNVRLLTIYALANAIAGRTAEVQRTIDALAAQEQAGTIRPLAISLIKGRIAELAHDEAAARSNYTAAAAMQDAVIFEAAPPWYFAPRELLAAMELRMGNPAVAIAVAQADLRKHQHNRGMLIILHDAYAATGQKDEAARIDRELGTLGL